MWRVHVSVNWVTIHTGLERNTTRNNLTYYWFDFKEQTSVKFELNSSKEHYPHDPQSPHKLKKTSRIQSEQFFLVSFPIYPEN